jgi:ATP-binding cassette subfamily C protein
MKDSKTQKQEIEKVISAGNRINYIRAIVLLSITSIYEVAIAYILMLIIDNCVTGSIQVVMKIAVFSIMIAFTYIIVSYTGYRSLSSFTKQGIYNLREKIILSIVHKPLNEAMEKTSGQYMSIITNDLTTIENNYIIPSVSIIQNVIMVIAALIVMFWTNWMLSLM